MRFVDDFSPVEKPKIEDVVISVPLHKRKLPPWNGYGSFEDSAQNCITVEPKQIFRDFKKFLNLDRYDNTKIKHCFIRFSEVF